MDLKLTLESIQKEIEEGDKLMANLEKTYDELDEVMVNLLKEESRIIQQIKSLDNINDNKEIPCVNGE